MSGLLAQRAAIVTGAGDGIGAAVARRFVEEGARVLAVDIDADKLNANVEPHERVVTVTQDVAALDAATLLVDRCLAEFGRLDILVNNAGRALYQPAATTDDEIWGQMLGLMLDGTFRLSRTALPHLTSSPSGRLLHVGSSHGFVTRPGQVAYSTAKAGLRGMSRALAVDLGPARVTSNLIVPGPILTGTVQRYFDQDAEVERQTIAETVLGRMGQPSEVAALAAFLASDQAAFITGAEIVIDGGQTIHIGNSGHA